MIDSLVSIRKERLQEEERRKSQQVDLLKTLHIPLEQSFIMELLEHQDTFSSVFHKYQELLSLPESCLYACICSFVEEPYLKNFATDIVKILGVEGLRLDFSILYVKNTAVLIFPATTLATQERIKNSILKLHYPNQSVTFETEFIHMDTSEKLFYFVIQKISRFERILLLSEKGRKL